MQEDIIDRKWPCEVAPTDGVTRVTALAPIGICRDCGLDIPGGHESMKCFRCRSHNEEWTDALDY